jgi:hypothetical protein
MKYLVDPKQPNMPQPMRVIDLKRMLMGVPND